MNVDTVYIFLFIKNSKTLVNRVLSFLHVGSYKAADQYLELLDLMVSCLHYDSLSQALYEADTNIPQCLI